ncbi:hypothetical protein JOF56_003712 [Kibdelosporangium banguiense]|uniref:Uncharacterized protein n=1 Tax=Kibdelosporangium banguiense TaxID=1365924 RepID=A0ABS4TFX7_9PSEU|nr:hypothetical protein [Kibdelosporangium banguiense]MBP2323327.1 hypothetical protein [Kibdelosporangium banguiense]
MTDPFTTVATELPRDRWGRPLITPPEGSEPVAYMRTTTFVGALEDTFHLGRWQMRMTALGMARRRDLQLAASAIQDPKDRYQKRTLNDLAKAAMEAASGSAAATTGTALHTFTENIDRGLPVGYVPEEYEADLEAYRQVTAGFAVIDIEGFCVCDHLRVGGSYDRIMGLPSDGILAPDWWLLRHPAENPIITGNVIWDLKTGGSIEDGLFGMGKIAMQEGVYTNSVSYDHTLGTRSPLPGNPRKDLGIVCHLPAGSGQAQLLWVDLESGWEMAEEVAPRVHVWRKRTDISAPFAAATARPTITPIPELIRRASSYAELQAIFAEYQMVWTPGLTALAAARKAELAV